MAKTIYFSFVFHGFQKADGRRNFHYLMSGVNTVAARIAGSIKKFHIEGWRYLNVLTYIFDVALYLIIGFNGNSVLFQIGFDFRRKFFFYYI